MSSLAWIEAFLLQAALVLLVWAAVSDARTFTIPNRLSLGIALLYPAYVLAAPQPVDWPGACAVAAAVFVVGAFAFARGWFGGGDVKLLAAVSLWAGPAQLPLVLLVTGLTGGLLGLLALAWLRIGWMFPGGFAAGPATGVERRPSLRTHVPYGVAIAVGGITAVLQLLRQ